MNKIIFIFILLSATFSFQGFADIKYAPVSGQSSTIIKGKTSKEKVPGIIANNFPQKAPYSSKKKKKTRCIKPFYGYLPEEPIYKTGIIAKELIFSSQAVYFFRLFFSNKKRGPPQII